MSLDYSRVYTAFESSMRALYTLNEKIVKITEDEEFSSLEKFYFDIQNFFPDSIDEEEVVEILSRFIKLDEEEDILRPKEILDQLGERIPKEYFFEDGTGFNTKLFVAEMLEWQKIDAESFSYFLRAVYKMTRDAPIKSELLRRGILLSAISVFDNLLEQLIQNSSNSGEFEKWKKGRWKKNEAPTFVGAKELYLSYHINDDKLKSFLNFFFSVLEEIIERRNVFSHSNGLVDEKYVRIAGEYAKNKKIIEGEQLRLSKRYMRKSLDLVHVFGLLLIQTLWRKSDNITESLDKADKKVITSQKLALQDERFEVAREISGWGDGIIRRESSVLVGKKQSEKSLHLRRRRYTFLINYAMSMSELENKSEMQKQIKRIRHPEWSYAVRSAVAILEGKYELALGYLEEAVKQESSITDLFLDDSPIFQRLADNPNYAKIRDLAKKNLS